VKEGIEAGLVFSGGILVLIGLAFPVGFLIGLIDNTLMLFPAYRQWRQEKAMFEWWEEHLRRGLHVNVFVRIGDGERRLVRSFDLGGPVHDSEVNPPEERVMDNESEPEKLTVAE